LNCGMAFIRNFEHVPNGSEDWQSEVQCGYRTGEKSGRTILRLETAPRIARF